MHILVTGGAGYIGSLTARHLADAGHSVVVLDDLRSGHPAAVEPLPLVVGDVRDSELVASTLERHGIDAVVHFAALKSVEDSVADPGGYFADNVGGTLGVLRAMARSGVRRFVFSSSCAVYGTPDTSRSTRRQRPGRRTRTARARSSPSVSCRGSSRRMGSGRPSCATSTRPAQQRTGRTARTGRRRRTSSRSCSSRRWAATRGAHLRDRLPDPRRDGHPRLRPRAGPGRGPRSALEAIDGGAPR